MLTTFYPPYHFGGDGVFVRRMAEGLAQLGHEVDVVYSRDAFHALGGAEPKIAFADHRNVTRHEIATSRPRLAALLAHQIGSPGLYSTQLRAVIEGGAYDVIHYHNVSLLGGPGLLKLGSAVKMYTPHDYWLICPTSALLFFGREACVERRCTACVVAQRRPPQVWRHLSVLRRSLDHVDMLLPTSRFSLERHRAAGITRPMRQLACLLSERESPPGSSVGPNIERPFFLYAGRLEKLKGVQGLLAVFADYREADLIVVGAGSYAPRLREQARGLKHVHFVDAVHPASLVRFYEQAIAVLVPSLCYETFCLTAAESLRLGTPVIVRDHGALREIVEETDGGLSFTTLGECREAMERLRTERGLRERMGRCGSEVARRRWSTDAFLQQYQAIVEDLLRGKASVRRRAELGIVG